MRLASLFMLGYAGSTTEGWQGHGALYARGLPECDICDCIPDVAFGKALHRGI